MKKSELKNGDIVICRCGAKGVIIKNENCEYILYSDNGGFDDLDDYNEDMTYMYPDSDNDIGDIMKVYRGHWIIGFLDYDDDRRNLIYEREETKEENQPE